MLAVPLFSGLLSVGTGVGVAPPASPLCVGFSVGSTSPITGSELGSGVATPPYPDEA